MEVGKIYTIKAKPKNINEVLDIKIIKDLNDYLQYIDVKTKEEFTEKKTKFYRFYRVLG